MPDTLPDNLQTVATYDDTTDTYTLHLTPDPDPAQRLAFAGRLADAIIHVLSKTTSNIKLVFVCPNRTHLPHAQRYAKEMLNVLEDIKPRIGWLGNAYATFDIPRRPWWRFWRKS